MKKLALVVVGDGRIDYLRRTTESANANLPVALFQDFIMVNDTGDAEYHKQLAALYPGYCLISHPERRGMAAAVQSGWSHALDAGADFVFHLEEDFTFVRPVPLMSMMHVLEDEPDLSQMVLRRQPWNEQEHEWGNLFGDDPRYVQKPHWIEHDVIFSLNPCIIPRWVLEMGWPGTNEAGMTRRLVAAGKHMAWWGQKTDLPDVTHIGHLRGDGWRL